MWQLKRSSFTDWFNVFAVFHSTKVLQFPAPMKSLKPSLFRGIQNYKLKSQNNKLNLYIHILFFIVPFWTFWNIFKVLKRAKRNSILERVMIWTMESSWVHEDQFGSHEPTLWLKNRLDHRVLQQMCKLWMQTEMPSIAF